MVTVDRELLATAASNLPGLSNVDVIPAVIRHKRTPSEMPVIVEALEQCSSAFGTDRARMMRQTSNGEWTVHTLHQGSVTSHAADQAEIAMAWMVGLSRVPVRVTRPRVTQADGSGIRPIAVTTYVGIPVLCQNHFAGVIELAGSDTADLVRVLDSLSMSVARLGYRLTHDPSIRAQQYLDMDVECSLDGGFWNPGEVVLSADEWLVLSAMGSPENMLRDVAATLALPDAGVIEVVQSLVGKGLVAVRATTRALSEDTGSSDASPSIHLDDGDD